MADRTVLVRLKADAAQFMGTMKQAAGSMTGLDKAQQQTQKNAEKWKAVGVASQVAGAGVAAGLLYAAKAASRHEQAMGALEAVFKSNTATMVNYQNQANELFWISKTEYAEAATKLGSQLINLGTDQSAVAETTNDLIGAAADMAAQFGGPTSAAIDAISAALRKERDPIEQYGITLTDVNIKAKMAAEGLTELEATLALIDEQMRQTGTFGAGAREYDTLEASAARLTAALDDLAVGMGEALLPVLARGAQTLTQMVQAFNGLPGPVKTVATMIGVLGAAAGIVGPKLLAMKANMALLKIEAAATGGSVQAAGSKFAAFGAAAKMSVLPLTAAMMALSAWAVHAGNVQARGEELAATLDEVTGAATRATAQNIGEEFARNFDLGELEQTPFALDEIVTAAVQGGQAFDDYRTRVADWAAAVSTNGTFAQARMANALLSAVDAAGRDADAMRDVAAASEAAADAAESSASASDRDTAAKRAEAAAVQALTNDLQTLLALNLALSGSQDALIGQRSRLTQAVEDNGKALQGHNQAAAANREAIRSEVSLIAALGKARYDALVAGGKSEAQAQDAANRVIARNIPTLIANAKAAGMSEAAVRKFVNTLLQTPDGKKVKLEAVGTAKATSDVDKVGKASKKIPAHVKTKLDAIGAGQSTDAIKGHNKAANQTPKSKSTRMSAPGAKQSKADVDGHNKAAGQTPKSKSTRVSAPGARQSKGEIDAHNKSAGNVPKSARTSVTAPGATTATGQLNAARSAALAAEGTYTITLRTVKVSATATASAAGGYIRGPGTSTSDSIPAWLSDGEYVVRASAVDKYGTGMLDRINAGRYRTGGKARRRALPKRLRKALPPWVVELLEKFGYDDDREWIEYNAPRIPGVKGYIGTGSPWRPEPEQRKGEKKKDYEQRLREWRQERRQTKQSFIDNLKRQRLDDKWEAKRQTAADREEARQKAEQDRLDDLAGARQMLIDDAADTAEAVRRDAQIAADAAETAYQRAADEQANYIERIRDALLSNLSILGAFDFKAHAGTVTDLADAEQAVADARKAMVSASAAERGDAVKAWRAANDRLAEAQKAEREAAHTPENILRALNERAATAEEYASRIVDLRNRGLSQAIIDELATADPAEVMDMLRAYSAMSAAQLAAVNAAQARVEAQATGLSTTLGTKYDAQVAQLRKAFDGATLRLEAANQPVVVQLDGATIARSVAEYQRRTGIVTV